jgi:hypothetical protein
MNKKNVEEKEKGQEHGRGYKERIRKRRPHM